MSKIVQHVPGYVDIDRDQIHRDTFTTKEELLALEWVASWAHDKGFYRYSITRDKTSLMGEYDEGRKWWVIGHLKGVGDLDLPEWQPVYD